MFSKSRKKYLFGSWKWYSQKREKGIFEVFKNVKYCFQAMESHLEYYWLPDGNRLVSFYARPKKIH